MNVKAIPLLMLPILLMVGSVLVPVEAVTYGSNLLPSQPVFNTSSDADTVSPTFQLANETYYQLDVDYQMNPATCSGGQDCTYTNILFICNGVDWGTPQCDNGNATFYFAFANNSASGGYDIPPTIQVWGDINDVETPDGVSFNFTNDTLNSGGSSRHLQLVFFTQYSGTNNQSNIGFQRTAQGDTIFGMGFSNFQVREVFPDEPEPEPEPQPQDEGLTGVTATMAQIIIILGSIGLMIFVVREQIQGKITTENMIKTVIIIMIGTALLTAGLTMM